MAYTAGQKVRATDLNTGLLAAVTRNATASTGLRVAYGSTTISFAAISFAVGSVNWSTAGFTQAPLMFAILDDNGGNGAITVHTGNRTTTAGQIVLLTAPSTNITATISVSWMAIGI